MHCGGRRRKKPERVKRVRACAKCGAHRAAKLSTACVFDGSVEVPYYDDTCQPRHWRSASVSHKASCRKMEMS
jgi:hypothetical protein